MKTDVSAELVGWVKQPVGKMRWTQTFYGDGRCIPPSCDNDFSHGLAKRMYSDREHTGFAICLKCIEQAEAAGFASPDDKSPDGTQRLSKWR